jgi:hypothetical protein
MRVEMVPKVWARYGELGACETDGGFFGYESVGGTLVLTASGTSFSGTFEFDAVDAKDTTKKIHVSGAFQNAALPAGAVPTPGTAQVVITGAVNETYTTNTVKTEFDYGTLSIILDKDSSCGVTIEFPSDSPPGTYAIENISEGQSAAKVRAVASSCDPADPFGYASTGGTLVLTASGTSFSGTFEFDGVNGKDPMKKIHVSGAFQNVPFTF